MATNGVLFATRYGTLWIVRLIPILALMGLLLRNANQIQTSRLTQVNGTGMYPDCAPDGQHIAFASITGLFAMRPVGQLDALMRLARGTKAAANLCPLSDLPCSAGRCIKDVNLPWRVQGPPTFC